MKIIFKCFGKEYTARVADRIPEVEKIDYTAGRDQIVACEPVAGIQTRDTDDGYYEFFEITEFWGSQCDDPADFSANSEAYYIAVWQEYEDAEADEEDEDEGDEA